MPRPLVVIPSYLSQPSDVDLLSACVSSLRRTAGDTVDILVVDDGSPAYGLVDVFEANAAAAHEVELVRQADNEGFARTVNVGLARARDEHREAVLVNADIVALTDGWLDAFRAADAAIVGAVLLSPRGPIAHAGFYFSHVTGTVEHRFAGAPADPPVALEVAACPVSGAFQYIRPEVLAAIGVYDREFRMGSEDLDFCLRAADAGFPSVCQGRARAVHVEAAFRGRPSPKLDAGTRRATRAFEPSGLPRSSASASRTSPRRVTRRRAPAGCVPCSWARPGREASITASCCRRPRSGATGAPLSRRAGSDLAS